MQRPVGPTATARLAELEELLARLRHEVCDALSPAMLMADMLLLQPDPQVRGAAERIAAAIEQANRLLRATRTVVPPRG